MSARPDGVSPPKSAGTSPAGLALAGGRCTRIGSNEALLGLGPPDPGAGLEGFTLLGRIGNVTLVTPPGRYQHLGISTVAGQVEGCGLLSRPFTVAADLRYGATGFFGELLAAAAVFQRRVKAAAESGVLSKRFKMQEFVSTLEQSGFEARIWPAPEAAWSNTPENTLENWPCLRTEAS